MELLIPGLILVALMVYASTRIKRVAAEAFEAESIEKDSFTIEKPVGFLNVIEPRSPLLLEGYTKEFGVEDRSDIKQAKYEIKLRSHTNVKQLVKEITSDKRVINNSTIVVNEKKYQQIAIENERSGINNIDHYRLTETEGGVLQLKIVMLDEVSDEVNNGVEMMLSSFRLK